MSYSSVTATFFALLLLGNIPVVYSAGYVSDACSVLCDTDGNRGDPLSSAETLSAYDTGTADDIAAAKEKYGQDINCWDISELTSLKIGYSDGTFTGSFNNRLDCWDTSRITSMYNTFRDASAFNQDIGMWNVSGVTTFGLMFQGASAFNQDINGWDTSSAVAMEGMFSAATTFNQDIGDWDISNVNSFPSMFHNAAAFNQDINGWDTSKASDCRNMFEGATTFNQDIGDWDTSKVNLFHNMFETALAFNQDIGDWDTSNADSFSSMFSHAIAFNQDISDWDTLKGKGFKQMFLNAKAFNQDIGDWDTSNTVDMRQMFAGSAFNQDINGWDTSSAVLMDGMFSAAANFNQDIGMWDVSKVTGIRSMFSRSTVFNQDIGMWDVSSVKNMYQMFHYATNFNQDISMWDVSSANNFREMFDYATAFKQDLSNWDTTNAASGNALTYVYVAPPTTPSTSQPTSQPTSSPTSSPTSLFDTNMILAVGEGGDGRPRGVIIIGGSGGVGTTTATTSETAVGSTTVPLTILTFFEAHQSLFEGEGGIDEAITIEVFANVAEDENDCTKGTLLENLVVDEENKFIITTESKRYENYNNEFKDIVGLDYPVTPDDVVGSASVTISDFQYVPTDENKNIWFPGRGTKDGEIELCVVTSTKIYYDNADGEREYYVSHMDSKRIISVDLVANIADQVVDITESKATTSQSDAVLEIDVDTFVCNNKNEKVKDDRAYKIGQYFRVCVGPTTEGVTVGYKVDNYIELTCGERSLINAGVVDSLTNIDTEYKNEKLAVRSVLTANDANGKVSVTCRGKVTLSYPAPTAGTLRYLKPSTELVTSEAAGKESLEGLFEMNIKMDIPGIESSAPPLTTRTTTIIGFGSVLSFVGVFLLM